MSNIPNLNDMLKLYTKKDLWDRVQEKNQIIANLNQQIHALQEQLKNAKPKFKYNQKVYASFKIPVSLGGSVMELKVKGFIPDDYDLLVILEDKNKERFELYQKSLFATREEALKRLAELEGK